MKAKKGADDGQNAPPGLTQSFFVAPLAEFILRFPLMVNPRFSKGDEQELSDSAQPQADVAESSKSEQAADQKSELHQRRQLIFRRVVLDNRPLPISELLELLDIETYTLRNFTTDKEAFSHVGCPIDKRKCISNPEDEELYFLDGPHTDDDTTRETISVPQKQLVARLAASLLCGGWKRDKEEEPAKRKLHDDSKENKLYEFIVPDEARKALERFTNFSEIADEDPKIAASVRGMLSRLREKYQKLEEQKTRKALERFDTSFSEIADVDPKIAARVRGMLSRQHEKYQNLQELQPVEEVLDLFNRSNSLLEKRQLELKRCLYSFWDESSRLVAIDSGTTNIMLARSLKKLLIPMASSTLSSLTVCTNSRRIFQELGPSNVWIKTIIIGGQQKFRSPTIAGAMAEAFLKSVAILQFGMCILGSTRVDLDRFAVCSDSQEESALKNLIMDRSSLRVILVDDSKFQRGPGREGYKFASIEPRQIDLIVTNSPLRQGKNADETRRQYEQFIKNIQSIEGRGVPVLVATSPATFDYPNEEPPAVVPPAPQSKKPKRVPRSGPAEPKG